MPANLGPVPYVCARCLRANRCLGATPLNSSARRVTSARTFVSSAPRHRDERHEDGDKSGGAGERPDNEKEQVNEGRRGAEEEEGAMTRRLRDMSESALETGGRSAQKAIEEASFSEELRNQLEERIVASQFRADNRNAFTEAELPSHAGRGTRDIATADPWTGQESLHDVSLRMLNDAHKPLRGGRGATAAGPAARLPRSIDTGRRSGSSPGAGSRLASARDRSGLYASLKVSDIDAQEREQRFQELKDRFSSDARSVPASIQGLANLANQRIEDAIARGQFKNLPRGKPLERDYNASNPFLDTTEYFMNKMIQKQDIVPPWIEKQQELVGTANRFRARIRNDWKRHAARTIASAGGSLQDQMRRAEAYAKAELVANPLRKKEETIATVDESGLVSQISLSGELRVPATSDAPVTEAVVDEKKPSLPLSDTDPTPHAFEVPVSHQSPPSAIAPASAPLRDPAWEQTEHSYHELAIADLNSKTRSYNLQAPDLAKKPYFSLARELAACYADVAPQLAEYIHERATAPRKTQSFAAHLGGGGGGGVLGGLVGEEAKVRDERAEKRYGLRQFWRDVWGNGGKV